jgi:hypothetical protein
MKTIHTTLLLAAALVFGASASFAGPSDSAAFAIKAAQQARERSETTIALTHSGASCKTMTVNSNNPKGQPYGANCSSNAVRNTPECKQKCAR